VRREPVVLDRRGIQPELGQAEVTVPPAGRKAVEIGGPYDRLQFRQGLGVDEVVETCVRDEVADILTDRTVPDERPVDQVNSTIRSAYQVLRPEVQVTEHSR